MIPQGTFTVLQQIERGRFRSRLFIQGPIEKYSDTDIIAHFGGDERFGDRIDRFKAAPDKAWVHVWSD